MKRYGVRQTLEPFDCFDRWEVVELGASLVTSNDTPLSDLRSVR